MVISVASGKGGTGKTTVAVNLALSIGKKLDYLDCDVEEPNSHIFLKPEVDAEKIVYIPIPKIDKNKCNFCGKCQQVCEYNAIAVIGKKKDDGNVLVFPELCHGCGGCSLLCPENAIVEVNHRIGILEKGYSNDIRFFHGRLDIGQAMAPPLIRAVKKRADYSDDNRDIIIDVPPGTSCPVVEAINDSDLCILVTEPTPFGLNDLKLAVELLRELEIDFGIVINRAEDEIDIIEKYCEKEDIDIMMRIPFDKKIAEIYSKGESIVENLVEYKNKFRKLYKLIKSRK